MTEKRRRLFEMTRLRKFPLLLALAFAVLVTAAGCRGGGDETDSGGQVTSGHGRGLTIAMVTHGDSGAFWSVVKKGADQAAKDMGVKLEYSESRDDPERQSQLIDAAVTEKVDGLAVSAANPEAIKGAVQKAVSAGIPVITLNSGAEESKALGAIAHVGQTETIAGEAAGQRLAQTGAKKLICVIDGDRSNIGYNQRCDGAKQGFGGEVENVHVKGVNDISTTLTEIQSKLESDDSIDAVLTLTPDVATAARDAIKGAGSDAKLATFDLSGDVVKAIKAGEIEFAIDQQQYLQGYLPVVFLTLYKENNNTIGGGKPVLTGPGFVDKDNAATVEKLAQQGTR
jgi:simple sugar transport system substrate-binding protein